MPLTINKLDDRSYEDLLKEALARIPVHTPEWTNFNESDPGVTIIELFAFLTENLLYRANQIPDRNRRKFLKLLGIPLQPSSSARGIVTFSNDRGPFETITLSSGLEVRAGQVPFRTDLGLDVLPIEAQIFYKRAVTASQELIDYYNQLYASYLKPQVAAEAQLYETVPFPERGSEGMDLGQKAIDGSLWIALLARPGETPAAAREKIGGKTLSLGIVPWLADASRKLEPGERLAETGELLSFEIPVGGALPSKESDRIPQYRRLQSTSSTDVLIAPGVVQITLPFGPDLEMWTNLDPLEFGVKDFPPAVDDTNFADRVITWLRIRSAPAARARLLWAGINAASVSQRAHVTNELLPAGTGTPDQVVVLSKKPVIAESVAVTLTVGDQREEWKRVEDLLNAGSEVPVNDPRLPPGTPIPKNPDVKVFVVDAESGEVRFGDGLRGARPPRNVIIRASYDYGVGRAGNVGTGAINAGPALPAGIKVINAVPTWGGADAETVNEGEKQVSRYLQHRDRLVSAVDFETIVTRTPGVEIARVDVLPAFNPELGSSDPGDAAGAVTVVVIPKYDPAQPDAPRPDRLFINAICAYIDLRRLVTTEVFLRGPIYKSLWVSIGINVEAGRSIAEIREAVKKELLRVLSPLPSDSFAGWPLRKDVVALELVGIASRVNGVSSVKELLLGTEDTKSSETSVPIRGLQLPRVIGISVSTGDAVSLGELRGQPTTAAGSATAADLVRLIPLPAIPEECQ